MPLPERLRNRIRSTFGEARPVPHAGRTEIRLSPQLVYLWGAAVICGSWQGSPGGFSRGLAEVPLSGLLVPFRPSEKEPARRGGSRQLHRSLSGNPKDRCRSATDKLRRSMSGKSKSSAAREAAKSSSSRRRSCARSRREHSPRRRRGRARRGSRARSSRCRNAPRRAG